MERLSERAIEGGCFDPPLTVYGNLAMNALLQALCDHCGESGMFV